MESLKMTRLNVGLVAVVAGLLTACGGGGGGGTTAPAPSPAPTPVSCAAQTLTYNACSYDAPALSSGGTASLTTKTTGYSGSATASCTNGTLSLVATAASCQKSGPTDADLAIQTSVPPLTYAVDAPERLVFEYMNRQRAQCGFGLLAQSASLDRAAKAHTDYILQRMLEGTGSDFTAYQAYLANPHVEIQGKAGFTGVTPASRASVAGFAGASIAEIGGISGAGVSGDGYTTGPQGHAIRVGMNLLASVYHLGAAMGPYRDAGVGQTFSLNTRGQPGSDAPTYMVLGYRQYPQNAASLRSYPCQGATEVEFAMGGETPNPFAGTSLSGTVVGQPIYFLAPRSATRLTIETLTIEPQNAPAGASSFSLAAGTIHLVTQSSDPNRVVKATEVFAVAKTQMLPSTTYRVSGRVLIDSTPQDVNFTFSTGIGSYATSTDSKYRTPAR